MFEPSGAGTALALSFCQYPTRSCWHHYTICHRKCVHRLAAVRCQHLDHLEQAVCAPRGNTAAEGTVESSEPGTCCTPKPTSLSNTSHRTNTGMSAYTHIKCLQDSSASHKQNPDLSTAAAATRCSSMGPQSGPPLLHRHSSCPVRAWTCCRSLPAALQSNRCSMGLRSCRRVQHKKTTEVEPRPG